MQIMKLIGRGAAAIGIVFTCIILAGCQSGKKPQNDGYGYDPLGKDKETAVMDSNSGLPGSQPTRPGGAPVAAGSDSNSSTAILQAGDTIAVVFNDLPNPVVAISDQIKEDGTVTLYFNEKFMAAGKTVRQLQDEVHDRYVPKYYKLITPSVTTGDRFFSVGGEVRTPNRYVWTPGMTVLRAIDSAGGFTDFSRKGSVSVTRANSRKQEHEDCPIKALRQPENWMLDHLSRRPGLFVTQADSIMVLLRILSGKMAGADITARRFPFRIGRSAAASLQLQDDGVWDQHLELAFDSAAGYVLTASPNALASINGQQIRQAVLRNGDIMEIGATKIRFWLGAVRQYGLCFRELLVWLACRCRLRRAASWSDLPAASVLGVSAGNAAFL